MKKTIEIHICDRCGKENNLGDQYESGDSVVKIKGSIGSSHSCGGYSFDETYDLCLSCTKEVKKFIETQSKEDET